MRPLLANSFNALINYVFTAGWHKVRIGCQKSSSHENDRQPVQKIGSAFIGVNLWLNFHFTFLRCIGAELAR